MKGNYESVYVNMMLDSLKKKKKILEMLLKTTRQQELLLKDEDMDPDKFQQLIDEKEEPINELNRMDEGFDRLFRSVEKEITSNKDAYKEQIQQMKQLIGEVSELGIQIQALEHQNSGHFKVYLAQQRKTIREFHVNKKLADGYYQNLANSHKPEQSYFFNETK